VPCALRDRVGLESDDERGAGPPCCAAHVEPDLRSGEPPAAPVFIMTDLDTGMDQRPAEPFAWDDERRYDRGKVLSAEQLEAGSSSLAQMRSLPIVFPATRISSCR
jgi:hypothetical protein